MRYTVGMDLGTTNIVTATCLTPDEGDPLSPAYGECFVELMNYPADYTFDPNDFVKNSSGSWALYTIYLNYL